MDQQYTLFPEIDDLFTVEPLSDDELDELNVTLKNIEVEYFETELVAIPVIPEPDFLDMPTPTEQDLKSPIFNALWDVVKTWDVNVPEYYSGYCGANGSHVKLLLNALEPHLNKSVKLPRF